MPRTPRLTAIWFAATAASACARERIAPPLTHPQASSRPQPVAARPAVHALIEGARAGIDVPAPMRLVAAYGDDTWQFPARAQFFSAGAGGSIVALIGMWNPSWIFVIQPATGQPSGSVYVGPERTLTAVAVDATGTRVAGLVDDGSVLYWPALDVGARHLVAQSAEPTSSPAENASMHRYQYYVAQRGFQAEDAWAFERASHRLSFSPDGARLLAGMHLYDVATGRDLTPLRTDEIVVDADHDAMTVASVIGWTVQRRPLTVVSLERRAVGAARGASVALPRPSRFPEECAYPSLSRPVHAVVDPRSITSIDLAPDRRIAFVQDSRGWLVERGQVRALQVPGAVAARTTFEEVALGSSGVFAVTRENRGGAVPSVVYAFAPDGVVRGHVDGRAEHVSRAGRAVLGDSAGRNVIADLAGAPHGNRVARANADAEDFGGRVVAGDREVWTRPDGDIARLVVRDPGVAPRTVAVVDAVDTRVWAVSENGATLATAGNTLHVVDVDTGREALQVDFDAGAEATALTVSAHLVAAADQRGHVRIWRDSTVAEINLAGRFDVAMSLAISSDETALAIGTARGRILVVEL